ncbi:hypothetical protein TWF281_001123 [Arthrobotrys megalospora]
MREEIHRLPNKDTEAEIDETGKKAYRRFWRTQDRDEEASEVKRDAGGGCRMPAMMTEGLKEEVGRGMDASWSCSLYEEEGSRTSVLESRYRHIADDVLESDVGF